MLLVKIFLLINVFINLAFAQNQIRLEDTGGLIPYDDVTFSISDTSGAFTDSSTTSTTTSLKYIVVPSWYYDKLRTGDHIQTPIRITAKVFFKTKGGACYSLKSDMTNSQRLTRHLFTDGENIPKNYIDINRTQESEYICVKRNIEGKKGFEWHFSYPLTSDICSKDKEGRLAVNLFVEEIGQANISNKISFLVFKNLCNITPVLEISSNGLPKITFEIETNTGLTLKLNGKDEENINREFLGETIHDSKRPEVGPFSRWTTSSYAFEKNQNRFLAAVKITPQFLKAGHLKDKVHIEDSYFSYEISTSSEEEAYNNTLQQFNTNPAELPSPSPPDREGVILSEKRDIEMEFSWLVRQILLKNDPLYKENQGIEIVFQHGDRLSTLTSKLNRLIKRNFSSRLKNIYWYDFFNHNYKLGNPFFDKMKRYTSKLGSDCFKVPNLDKWVCPKDIKAGDRFYIPIVHLNTTTYK